jgi:N4-gp56 family major capsid protein
MGSPTGFATDNALTKKLWSEKLYRDTLKDIFLTNMIGKGADSIIEMKSDLEKEKGDNVTFGLRMRMTDAGQSSSTTGITLEGNEVAMTTYDFSVSLTEYGQSIKAQSKLSLKRPAFDLRTEMKDTLKDWAAEKLETIMLNALLASPSTNRYIEKTGVMAALDVEALRRKAKTVTPTIRPITIKGKKYFVLLAHPYALKGLKADDDFRNANMNARDRGVDNPLIQGADLIYDGVLIYEYNRSEMLLTGNVCRSLLLGAQAGALAWAQKPSWMEKDFDYDRIPGVAVDMLLGFGKTKFNSQDYGCIAIDNAYVAD